MKKHSMKTTGIQSQYEWEQELLLRYDTLPPWYWTYHRDNVYKAYVRGMEIFNRRKLLKKIGVYTLWAFLIAGGLYVGYYLLYASLIAYYFYFNGFGN